MTGEPLLEIRDATVVRDGRPILRVDRFEIREGEHLAIIGPNGAGKSTLVGLLSREIRPLAHEDGSAAVLVRGRPDRELFELRRLVGVVSQRWQVTFERPVTVRDVLVSGFFGSVGLFAHQPVTPAMLGKADELMAFLGIEGLADRTMDTLSTGEGRRALIGRALVHDPPVLVLDEPCDGLDLAASRSFLGLVRTIALSGRTIVLVTHHIGDIIPEVTRVVMMCGGSVLADGPKPSVLESERLSELYGVDVEVERRGGWYAVW